VIPQPRTVTLTDNRVVGLYEYGDPDGQPVLTFHGVPACGAGFDWADEPARTRGLRIIAPDRPGVGRSSRADGGFTVASEAGRMDRLCEALGIDRFALWGYSGGGPYAVACAALLGDRVTATAVAAGMGQIGVWAEVGDFAKTDRQMLDLSTKHPALARVVMGTTGRLARLSPKAALKSFEGELGDADREVAAGLGEPKEAMALFTQAFLQGARGVVDDYRAINGPWGVDLAAITTPVSIWQGDADTMVPLRHAEELQARIPGAELHVWPGEGHLGTITHVEDILDWLATVTATSGG
jgi:pimeloyl-ACP methyl ester carboxylesterase